MRSGSLTSMSMYQYVDSYTVSHKGANEKRSYPLVIDLFAISTVNYYLYNRSMSTINSSLIESCLCICRKGCRKIEGIRVNICSNYTKTMKPSFLIRQDGYWARCVLLIQDMHLVPAFLGDDAQGLLQEGQMIGDDLLAYYAAPRLLLIMEHTGCK